MKLTCKIIIFITLLHSYQTVSCESFSVKASSNKHQKTSHTKHHHKTLVNTKNNHKHQVTSIGSSNSAAKPSRVSSNKTSWTLLNFNGQTDAYIALFGKSQTKGLESYKSIVKDPLGTDQVMKVFYGLGSFGTHSNGGQNFYASPPIDWSNAKKIEFCYKVMFQEGFDFGPLKYGMGKLPGLYGGAPMNCVDPSICFSMRFMWRPGGLGEIYPTIDLNKQPAGFCANPKQCLTGPGSQGISVGRGSFTYPTGQWFKMCQIIGNSQSNGGITVIVGNNINPVINWNNLSFPNVPFSGIQFATFFGGGQQSASTKDQSSYFKDFSLVILE
jgi:hypothetical protein